MQPGAPNLAIALLVATGQVLNVVHFPWLNTPLEAKGLSYDLVKSHLPMDLPSMSVSPIQGKLPPTSVQNPALEKSSVQALKQVLFELAWTLWKAKKTRILLVQFIVEGLTVRLGEFIKKASPGRGIPDSVPALFEGTSKGLNGLQFGIEKKTWKAHKYKTPPAQDLASFSPLSYLAGHLKPD